jgi:hypothetical protein
MWWQYGGSASKNSVAHQVHQLSDKYKKASNCSITLATLSGSSARYSINQRKAMLIHWLLMRILQIQTGASKQIFFLLVNIFDKL